MKQADHRALAHHLLSEIDRVMHVQKRCRCFFFFGNLLPDFLPFTYLRGFWRSHGLCGHDAPYSESYIRKNLARLVASRGWRCRDFYRMGCVMHYLADSFTFAHTASFGGDLRMHRSYERALHGVFRNAFEHTATSACTSCSCMGVVERERRRYLGMVPSIERDCAAIVLVCSSVLHCLLKDRRIFAENI